MANKNYIQDSTGRPHVRMAFIADDDDVADVEGNPIHLIVDQVNADTPYGERLITIVHILPLRGGNAPTSGSAIHNPTDPFSYRDGFVWAAYRAGLGYVYSNNRPNIRKFRRTHTKADVERKVRAWARYTWYAWSNQYDVDPDAEDRAAWAEAEEQAGVTYEQAQAMRDAAESGEPSLEELMEMLNQLSKDVEDVEVPSDEEIVDVFNDLCKHLLGEPYPEPIHPRSDPVPADDPEGRVKALEEKLEELKARMEQAKATGDVNLANLTMTDLMKTLIEA